MSEVKEVDQGQPVLMNVQDDGSQSVQREGNVETEPKLNATVAGPCNNPNGLYVGLSKAQREALGVDIGGTVMLRTADGKILGIFTVGTGSKELLGQPKITANGIEVGMDVIAVKANANEGNLNSLPLKFAAENDEKHVRRSGIIVQRFGQQGFNGESYIVLPTAIAKELTGQGQDKSTVASIALGKIRICGVEKTLPIVPAGSDFAMTSKAAQELGITTSGVSKVDFYFKDGPLVVNQIG